MAHAFHHAHIAFFAAAAAERLARFHMEVRSARRKPGPDAIHDLRVAARRLAAALALIRACGRSRKKVKKARGKLRRIVRAVGRVRDLDIHLEFVRAYRSKRPRKERRGLNALVAILERRRKAAERKALKVLARLPGKDLLETLKGRLLRCRRRAPPSGSPMN